MGFPCDSIGKESSCSAGDLGLITGLGRSPGEGIGNPLQYPGLENSMDCIVHGVTKSWTWLSDLHFTSHPRVMKIKTKINKWDLINLKSFCTEKEAINKEEEGGKATLRVGENICQWSNQQRINIRYIQTAHAAQYQKHQQHNKKVGRSNKHFSKEDIQMTKKDMKRYSISLIIREILQMSYGN